MCRFGCHVEEIFYLMPLKKFGDVLKMLPLRINIVTVGNACRTLVKMHREAFTQFGFLDIGFVHLKHLREDPPDINVTLPAQHIAFTWVVAEGHLVTQDNMSIFEQCQQIGQAVLVFVVVNEGDPMPPTPSNSQLRYCCVPRSRFKEIPSIFVGLFDRLFERGNTVLDWPTMAQSLCGPGIAQLATGYEADHQQLVNTLSQTLSALPSTRGGAQFALAHFSCWTYGSDLVEQVMAAVRERCSPSALAIVSIASLADGGGSNPMVSIILCEPSLRT